MIIGLKKPDLEKLGFAYSEKTVFNFQKSTNQIYQKMKNNSIELNYLTKTRDTLLPKLMSGEIRV